MSDTASPISSSPPKSRFRRALAPPPPPPRPRPPPRSAWCLSRRRLPLPRRPAVDPAPKRPLAGPLKAPAVPPQALPLVPLPSDIQRLLLPRRPHLRLLLQRRPHLLRQRHALRMLYFCHFFVYSDLIPWWFFLLGCFDVHLLIRCAAIDQVITYADLIPCYDWCILLLGGFGVYLLIRCAAIDHVIVYSDLIPCHTIGGILYC